MSRSTRAARKVREAQQRDKMYSAAGPYSLVQMLEHKLLDHCKRHIEMKKIPFGEDPDRDLNIRLERGIIHGLAMSVALMRYAYQDQIAMTKKVTKQFYRLAKEGYEPGD